MRSCIERSRLRSGAEEWGETGGVFMFRFAESEPVFRGHFPGHPILPGVFQIEMTRMAAEWATGRRWAMAEIRKAKFSRPIFPGDMVKLSLEVRLEGREAVVGGTFRVGDASAGQTQLRLVSPAG